MALHGNERIEQVELEDAAAGRRRIPASAVFVMAGAQPDCDWLSGLVALDNAGYILTGAAVGQSAGFETSHPGIFAVGDVRAGSVKRVASAVGEGSVVISEVWNYLSKRDEADARP